MNHHGIDNSFLYAVSQIKVLFSNGKPDETMQCDGTGFFIKKGKKEFFITNRHVLDPERSEDMAGKGYSITQIVLDHRNYDLTANKPLSEERVVKQCHWFFAENDFDDIACIINIEYYNESVVRKVNIDFNMLATSDMFLNSFTICDMLAFIGFPRDQYDDMHKLPIVRCGIISSDPRINYPVHGSDMGNAVAYETFSTPGSSGSPVFALQKGIQLGNGLTGSADFYRPVKLIGINTGHKNDPNTGVHSQLSYFYRSDRIIAIIEAAEKQQ